MGPQAANANTITSHMTLSERADHLEEQMMHELDKIVTKSVFSNLTDGVVGMEGGAALKVPGENAIAAVSDRNLVAIQL